MTRRTPVSTLTDTLFPYPTLFRVPVPGPAGSRRRSGSDARRKRTRHRYRANVRGGPAVPDSFFVEKDALAQQPSATCRRFPLGFARSEEHTSELQSLMRISYAVFCLKKKKNTNKTK